MECKQQNKMIRGPFSGFLLKSPEQKTVIIFGENHHSDIPCSKDEELFTNLFQSLVANNKKEPVKVILELYEDAPIYFSKNTIPTEVSKKDLKKSKYGIEGKQIKERVKDMPNPDARLHKMLKIWSDKCSVYKECKIDSHYSNTINIDSLISPYLKT